METIEELYDNFFGLKNGSDVFRVQIIKCDKDTSWYSTCVGENFYVIDDFEGEMKEYLKVMRYVGRGMFSEEGAYIKKTDAIILS